MPGVAAGVAKHGGVAGPNAKKAEGHGGMGTRLVKAVQMQGGGIGADGDNVGEFVGVGDKGAGCRVFRERLAGNEWHNPSIGAGIAKARGQPVGFRLWPADKYPPALKG